METTTNNIVNADTTGYKKEHLVSHSFDEVLVRRLNDSHILSQRSITGLPRHLPHNYYFPNRAPAVGPLHLGTQVDQLYIDFTEGNLDGTERSTDLALVGDVFFVMQTPDGERYTRTGAFYINEQGYLIDGEGHELLGENGPIYVGGLNFNVDVFGGVWVDNAFVDTIRVVSFEDNGMLRRQGSNLYYSLEEPQAAPNPYRIMQGFLETSNVDIGREMVDMLSLYRTYETNQRMITMIDETVGKAVNEIGRLR
jgi:flagellar basal-body rod protein FlgG